MSETTISSILSGPAFCQPAQRPLSGQVDIPGDKSISHRSLMLGAIAMGTTHISGLLEGEDVLATARAMQSFGAKIERVEAGVWHVRGNGIGNFVSPSSDIDFGNAGTGCRLTMGLVAASPCSARFIGDASLSKRPMKRVLTPLKMMGLSVEPNDQDHLPLTLTGPARPLPISYRLPVASAQVKSAILLAALTTPGETHIIEPHPTRDHTERMLALFGAKIRRENLEDGHHVWLEGEHQLAACDIVVPGDPSSAAFPIIAALLVPHSSITVRNVMINPHRDGLFHVLRRMGAKITPSNEREAAGEIVADLTISAQQLAGVDVEAEIAPSMIDEYPALAMVAAAAKGKSIFRGLGELRVKESDRLAALSQGLQSNGVANEIDGDDLIIYGSDLYAGGQIEGGGLVSTFHDHRIAMSFLLLGLASHRPVTVDDVSMIATSFPNFIPLMESLGVSFCKADAQ